MILFIYSRWVQTQTLLKKNDTQTQHKNRKGPKMQSKNDVEKINWLKTFYNF